MLSMLPKQRVWRRLDRVRQLAPGTATFPDRRRRANAWWYGLGLQLQDERQPFRPMLLQHGLKVIRGFEPSRLKEGECFRKKLKKVRLGESEERYYWPLLRDQSRPFEALALRANQCPHGRVRLRAGAVVLSSQLAE